MTTHYQIEDTGNGFYVWDSAGRNLGPVEAAKALADRLLGVYSISELRRLVDAAETDYQFEGYTAVRFSSGLFAEKGATR